MTTKLGELATAFEERTLKAHQADALEAVRTDYPKYFEALDKHPRLLVGAEVPAAGKEGMEVLQNEADARSWQEASKGLLVQEIQARANKSMESQSDYVNAVHDSIKMFQSNPDLIPGSKTFDVELANQLTTLIKPYEMKLDGKLHGYTIPVQPIIDQLRAKLATDRAAAAESAGGNSTAAPATPPPAAAPGGTAPAAPVEQPQEGVTSKAGAGAEGAEDFSTLFGTLGLPDLRI